MAIAISSTSKKYVYTQAAAPSGEGEVEGSIWYDTTSNVLYAYDGAAWNIVVPSVGGLNLIEAQKDITGVTEIDFNSVPAKKQYAILFKLDSGGAPTSLRLLFNDDTGATYNYHRVSNTTISNNTGSNYMMIGTDAGVGMLIITPTMNGMASVSTSLAGSNNGTRELYLGGQWASAAAITKITMQSGTASGLTGDAALYYIDGLET